jgi:hypothetical protein
MLDNGKNYKSNKMNTLNLRGIRNAIYAGALAIALASCTSPSKLSKSLDKMSFKPETEALEVHGDSIRIVVKGKIPPKTFHKKAIVKFQPVLRYGDELTEEKELAPLYLQGEKVKKEKKKDGSADKGKTKVIKYAKGGAFTYNETVEYTQPMKKAKLGMDYQVKIASSYNELDQCVTGKRDSALKGTKTTSLLVKPLDDVLFYTQNEKADDVIGTTIVDNTGTSGTGNMSKKNQNVPDVVFYHVLDETILRDSVNRGGPNKKLQSILAQIAAKNSKAKKGKANANDPQSKVVVKGLIIKSYASPDGELNHNADLCKGRSNSGFKWVKKEMKRYGIKDVYDKDIMKQPDANEDWAGFKNLVTNSSFAGRDEILGIINSNMDVESKEKAFRASSAWPELKDNILPKLRRTEIYIDAEGIEGKKSTSSVKAGPRTVEEIKTAYNTGGTENISQKEMFLLAASTDDMMEKERIYQAYASKYPNDAIGQSNYAAAMLKNGSMTVTDYRTALTSNPKIDEAVTALEKLSATYPNNDTIKNNLAVANRFKRKYVESAEGLVYCKSKGFEESNNLGILSIKTGKYADAISNFKPDQCDFNVCLAYVLNKEYDKALEKITCTKDAGKANADLWYLKAIVHARQANKTDMATALAMTITEAKKVGKEADYKDQIMKDLEFGKYLESAEFKNAMGN